MKFSTLRSVAHNISISLTSGVGLPIGARTTDIFGEANGDKGYIEVDFLTGKCEGNSPSSELSECLMLYVDFLGNLCKSHRLQVSDFAKLNARYAFYGAYATITVSVADKHGRSTSDEYDGTGSRLRLLDRLGRLRKKPPRRTV